MGPAAFTNDIYYRGTFSTVSGPTNFGSGNLELSPLGSGDTFGLAEFLDIIVVPSGYVSEAALSGTSTFSNTTLAAMGATPGIFTWTWGSGVDADSATLNVGEVPESGTFGMVGVALALIVTLRGRFLSTFRTPTTPRYFF